MHPTLLIGPADWDPQLLPREEFATRTAALFAALPADVGGVIVHGDQMHHAELAYLTNFTPKLEPAIALIARGGAARMLVGGGINMLAAAKPLTFVESLLPLRDAGAVIAAWTAALSGRPVLIGGDAMTSALHAEAFAASAPADATATLWALMRRKSARELALLRSACATLAIAMETMASAWRNREGVTACVLAAEHAAQRAGAQDVRTLFSRDGGRTLEPFTRHFDATVDPLQAYAAVRRSGYWAEGFVALSHQPHPARNRSFAALSAAVALAGPQVSFGDIERALAKGFGRDAVHPMLRGAVICSLGLALGEPSVGGSERLVPGGIYSLRFGLAEESGAAVVSAIIAVDEQTNEMLWPPEKKEPG